MMMRLLEKGRLVHAAHFLLENMPRALEHEEHMWVKRQEKLEVTRKVDHDVRAAWSTQYKIDVSEFTIKNAVNINKYDIDMI